MRFGFDVQRTSQLSVRLKVADCVFAGCPLKVSLEMSVPTISSALSLTPITRWPPSILAHVGDDIIFLVLTERVLQILKFFPFAASILLWVLMKEVLL